MAYKLSTSAMAVVLVLTMMASMEVQVSSKSTTIASVEKVTTGTFMTVNQTDSSANMITGAPDATDNMTDSSTPGNQTDDSPTPTTPSASTTSAVNESSTTGNQTHRSTIPTSITSTTTKPSAPTTTNVNVYCCSKWSPWSSCSSTCRKGFKTAIRTCPKSPSNDSCQPNEQKSIGSKLENWTEPCYSVCPLTVQEKKHVCYFELYFSTNISAYEFNKNVREILKSVISLSLTDFCANEDKSLCCGKDKKRKSTSNVTFAYIFFGSDTPSIRREKVTVSIYATRPKSNGLCYSNKVNKRSVQSIQAAVSPRPGTLSKKVLFSILSSANMSSLLKPINTKLSARSVKYTVLKIDGLRMLDGESHEKNKTHVWIIPVVFFLVLILFVTGGFIYIKYKRKNRYDRLEDSFLSSRQEMDNLNEANSSC